MKLATPVPWSIEVPETSLTKKFAPKLETLFSNGYVVNTVSNPALLLKHILWEAYTRSKPVGLGIAAHKELTPEEVYNEVMTEQTGNRVIPEYWNAGSRTKHLLGFIPKQEKVNFAVKNIQLDYINGSRVKWALAVDEFGNFYLPKGFRDNPDNAQSPRREVREMAEAAIARAKKEDPLFRLGAISNRLPPEIEKGVNSTHIEFLRARRERGTLVPGCSEATLKRIRSPEANKVVSELGGQQGSYAQALRVFGETVDPKMEDKYLQEALSNWKEDLAYTEGDMGMMLEQFRDDVQLGLPQGRLGTPAGLEID